MGGAFTAYFHLTFIIYKADHHLRYVLGFTFTCFIRMETWTGELFCVTAHCFYERVCSGFVMNALFQCVRVIRVSADQRQNQDLQTCFLSNVDLWPGKGSSRHTTDLNCVGTQNPKPPTHLVTSRTLSLFIPLLFPQSSNGLCWNALRLLWENR